jgi:uncharacterized protein YndB with AHSA1/START domain
MSGGRPEEGVFSATTDATGLEIVRIFDAPRELVYEAWTVPERFGAWFGEHGSTIPAELISMDVRPGGSWSATMIYGPEETEIPFTGEFRELLEPARIVMTLNSLEDPSNGVEILTVDLDDLGDGRTRMTFSQRGTLPAGEYPRAMNGWLIFFDRMGENVGDHLKARHDQDD